MAGLGCWLLAERLAGAFSRTLACGLSMWLPFLTERQLGSEREYLRMSLPRDSGRDCQIL